jgi:nucleoside-diphosphate-sugar epimerase
MSESLWMIYDVAAGNPLDKAGLPLPYHSYVDVRDVARLFTYSVEHPDETDGQRYILAAANGPPQSVADILREALPAGRRDVIQEGTPGKGYLPGYAWDAAAGPVVDNTKARKVLGAFIPWETTVVDTAKSFEHLF